MEKHTIWLSKSLYTSEHCYNRKPEGPTNRLLRDRMRKLEQENGSLFLDDQSNEFDIPSDDEL